MNAFLSVMNERRSARSFLPGHVSKQLVETIAEAGLRAPSGRNLQTPRLVVVQDDETVRQLSKLNAAVLGMEDDPFYGAPDVIVVLAKREGTYVYDGSLAMGNMLNAAWSLGVGACWIHRAKEVFASGEGRALLKKWGIEEEVEGIGFCILGKTDKEKDKTDVKSGRIFYV